jgi:FKBP-type peptidyl-prolyl cis-trans isomerase SlyD
MIMKVGLNKVVAIHYTLTNNEGTVLDSSNGRDPLNFIHGLGHLIPGMEEGLHGKEVGNKFQLKVKSIAFLRFSTPQLFQLF